MKRIKHLDNIKYKWYNYYLANPGEYIVDQAVATTVIVDFYLVLGLRLGQYCHYSQDLAPHPFVVVPEGGAEYRI